MLVKKNNVVCVFFRIGDRPVHCECMQGARDDLAAHICLRGFLEGVTRACAIVGAKLTVLSHEEAVRDGWIDEKHLFS